MRKWRASQRFQRKPTLLLSPCVYIHHVRTTVNDLQGFYFVKILILFYFGFVFFDSSFIIGTFDPDKRWKTCFQSYSFFACNNNVRHFGVPFLFAPFALLIASRSVGFRKPFHSSSWRITTTDKCR